MSFPALYQAHHSLYHEDLDFWLKLPSHYPGRVLEAGCGTGRVLIPLADTGVHVIGLDKDFGMLKLLQNSLSGNTAQNVTLIQADFRNFHLDATFGLILLTCNTFTAFPQSHREKVLACVRKHLKQGGVFAISLPNPEILRRLPHTSTAQLEEIFPHPDDGEPVQVSSAWRRDSSSVRFKWNYDHLLPNGEIERVTVESTQFLTSFTDLKQEFQSAGFHIKNVWGDFDLSDFSSVSPNLIFLVSRSAV